LAALPARAIAEKLGIPAYPAYLQHVHTTAVYPSAMMPAAPWLGGVYNRLTYALGGELFWWAMRPIISAWRQERLGLPALPRRSQFAAWIREPKPCFYGFSPTVVPRPPEWGDHIHITGYWFLPAPASWQPPAGLADFLAAGPPPVFVGFGSMTGRNPEQMAELVLAALARSRQRGLLLTGWGGLKPGDLPGDVYAIEAAPFDWLFPRVAAVVHHGGAGTTGAGLAAGKPSIVVPFFADQHFWAWRVAALGAGPRPIPRRQLSAERLAAAITEVTTSPAIQARAAALGERIRAEDGVGTVVRLASFR
jgi:UDP:flavonoid glycosyltransferase YjiC (YdhE family)